MALKIINTCVNCYACQPLCPSDAIYKAEAHFLINPKKCTECYDTFADPQCATICPIEGAILDRFGAEINPPGSLTGIPPERMAEAMAMYQAR